MDKWEQGRSIVGKDGEVDGVGVWWAMRGVNGYGFFGSF